MSVRSLMPVRIVHRLTVEFCPMIARMLPALRHRPVISMPVVKMMVYMPVEMIRPVKPRPSADENAAIKPLRTIIPIRCAIVRRHLVVAVRTARLRPNIHRNLSRSRHCRRQKSTCRHSRQT